MPPVLHLARQARVEVRCEGRAGGAFEDRGTGRDVAPAQGGLLEGRQRRGPDDRGQTGLKGDWENQTITLYGRNNASGTYGFFKEHALFNGDFKDTVKEQPGSSTVVQGVASDKYGIGYSGIGYKTADVKALFVSKDDKAEAFECTPDNAYASKYPLTRLLYVYVNYKPQSQLDPLRREFLRFVLSRQGQEDVVKEGYYPLTPRLVAEALKAIGVENRPVEAGSGH